MIAVIDIGSNSVRLMLWADGKSFYKKLETTRLGLGASSGVLTESAMEGTAQAVLKFTRQARSEGAKVYLFATAAVRLSENGGEFCKRVFNLTGEKVDVVSGEEEAQLALCGAFGKEDGSVIDIGGGSTEICVRKEGKISFSKSFRVGAVRLFEECGEDRALIEGFLNRTLRDLPVLEGKTAVVGGTATCLACVKAGLSEYDGEKIQDLCLSAEDVREISDRLFSLSAEERKKIRGMDPARADIIAGGAFLLFRLMEKLSLREVFASDRDNLEGYLTFRGLI